MGLFSQQPEHNEDWAGLPSEPARRETEAERLGDAAPVDVAGLGGPAVVAESIVIPVVPVIEIAESQESSGAGG